MVEFSVRAISEAEDLGRFLAELVMMLLAHPQIAAHEIVLEPSAPPIASL